MTRWFIFCLLLTACSSPSDQAGDHVTPTDDRSISNEHTETKPPPTREQFDKFSEGVVDGADSRPKEESHQCAITPMKSFKLTSISERAFSKGGIDVIMPQPGIGCTNPNEGHFCMLDQGESLILIKSGQIYQLSISGDDRIGVAFSDNGIFCQGVLMETDWNTSAE